MLQDALLKKIEKSHILQKIARYDGFFNEKDVFMGHVTLAFLAKKSHPSMGEFDFKILKIFYFLKKKSDLNVFFDFLDMSHPFF